MRKRSKKRVPQDVKPWIGVNTAPADELDIANKKTTKWVAGSRRDWDTKVLNQTVADEISVMLSKALTKTLSEHLNNNLFNKLDSRIRQSHKMGALSRYKNYCLLSGRGRTYNRPLHIARHNLRKLAAVGAISGLIK